MYNHIVLFNFPADTAKKTIDEVLEAFGELRNIPGVRAFAVGPEAKGRTPSGWSHVAIMTFDDEHSLPAFYDHSLHMDFVKNQLPLFGSYIGFDVVV